ncbi:retrovirus-related pol polyprotein from transposon TNT 1-94 [Tanacetum coccineum]|uniref:Retrovirus-related pol polyprotein from transposon TNT 1-94 n=1 Tax=Tanacetum coccineum TaxID=301880 RepID=A0ABQ4YG99_9ASTR
MDVKTAFLNGLLKEVYISQPDGFVDPYIPDHVYKLKKPLCGLKQAPRAWYYKLSSFLIENHSIKVLLKLRVHQSPRGIFISQSQSTLELLKKHGMDGCDSISTPMATAKLDADLHDTLTDQTKYRSMIGGLMYLTASRPNIAFVTFICARYQAWPTVKHFKEGSMTNVKAYQEAYNFWEKNCAIAISCNPVQHSRTKHINIRYHVIKEHVKLGTVELYFVRMEYQLADLFTKALPKERFEYLVHRIEFIMAQKQPQQIISRDLLVPPNKQYGLVEANKKIDLTNPSSSKILGNILRKHLLCFSLIASTLVPWIYIQKIIVDHIQTENPDIPKRLNEPYHKVEHDDVVKSISNSRKNNGLGMRISEWMLTKEMKQTKHYKLYDVEFGIDVPITQILRRRQPDPVTPILTAAQIDVTNLDVATQMSLATARSIEDFEAQQAMKKVDEHLMDEDIKKLMEGDEEFNANKSVDDILNSQEDLKTRIEPRSHKERPKVEKNVDLISIEEEVEEESAKDDWIRKKEKGIVEIKDTPIP